MPAYFPEMIIFAPVFRAERPEISYFVDFKLVVL